MSKFTKACVTVMSSLASILPDETRSRVEQSVEKLHKRSQQRKNSKLAEKGEFAPRSAEVNLKREL